MSEKIIQVFYKPEMVKENGGFSPSSFKPVNVIEDWNKFFGNSINIVRFDSVRQEDFYKIHHKAYVDGIFDGSIKNGYGLKSKEFAQVFCATSGSLLAAARQALRQAVAVSPTSGFHHARWSAAEGFCTFNGLVLSSVVLQEEGLVKKVGIIDFDMHFGNGTEEIIKKYGFDNIVHYTAGKKYDLHFPGINIIKPLVKVFYNKSVSKGNSKPVLRQKLLRAKGKVFLNEIDQILSKFRGCDLLIYQAGADQHINDPYGGLLTYEQMTQRDRAVFSFAKEQGIPIVWNLAGGYQKDDEGTIEPVLKCHRQTMAECLDIFSRN